MRTERWGLMALLVVTLVWGTTFPAMKLLSAQLDALQIIWGRFAIALLVLAPLWWGMRRSERRWGLLLGALLFLAFWLQIEGLARTSSAITKRSQMICSASRCAESSFIAGKVVPHTTVTASRASKPQRSVRIDKFLNTQKKKGPPVARAAFAVRRGC